MHSTQCPVSFKVIEGVVVQAVFVHDLYFKYEGSVMIYKFS